MDTRPAQSATFAARETVPPARPASGPFSADRSISGRRSPGSRPSSQAFAPVSHSVSPASFSGSVRPSSIISRSMAGSSSHRSPSKTTASVRRHKSEAAGRGNRFSYSFSSGSARKQSTPAPNSSPSTCRRGRRSSTAAKAAASAMPMAFALRRGREMGSCTGVTSMERV